MTKQEALFPLISWFKQNRRIFPWREKKTPYRVFVSEIMLQQTQASVVIPYYESWMQRFPTLEALSLAKEEDVIKAWEGLGYYSRARRLLEASKMIMERFGGEFPKDPDQLASIPGIGPYTQAAVLAFAFHERKAAVDGNVARVLTRFLGHFGDLKRQGVWKELRYLADNLLPEKEPWIASEALIELGAMICKKEPECLRCPLNASCVAFAKGLQKSLPVSSEKTVYENLERLVIAAWQDNSIFLERREGGIMQGLFEFPFLDVTKNVGDFKSILQKAVENWGIEVERVEPLPLFRHTFTRFRVKLYPFLMKLSQKSKALPFSSYTINQAAALPFSSGHRRLKDHLFKEKLFDRIESETIDRF